MSGHELGYEVGYVKFGLIVSSDSVLRGIKKDEITPLVKELVESHGHILNCSKVVGNSKEDIVMSILRCIEQGSDVVIVTGGTGVSSKDVSIDAIKRIADYELPGFGELFRYLSFKTIGARAWISRASAFIYRDRVIISVPGNPQAVYLALKELILPVIKHLVYEVRR